MRKQLTALQVLKAAGYRSEGVRRWDITDQMSVFFSAHDDIYDQQMLWKNSWCLHIHWKQGKEVPWVPVKISKDAAWNILLEKYGEWR